MQKRVLILALLLSLALSTAGAEAVSGLSYDTFLSNYTENLNFINDNAGRHLLPLIPSHRDAGWGDGRAYYEILGDVLSLIIRTDASGEIIETCQISLTAPADMAYGSAVHRDFTTSGFQHYGMLMAMSPAQTAYERYALVQEVEQGLASSGVFHKQVGVYTLDAVTLDGTVVVTFTNNTAAPTPSPVPTPSPTPGPEPAEPMAG